MKYKATTIKKGALFTKGVVEDYSTTVKNDKKTKARLKIQDEVFDIADSVSDNSKMISLLLTIISRMYDTFDVTQKDLIPVDDKALIEYAFSQFSLTQTSADNDILLDSTGTIDKLLERQGKIGAILK